jgi:uncharacterized protein YjlB
VNCAAIIRGSSRLALGRSKEHDATDGIEVNIRTGDVIVIPAGVSHRSIESEEGFRYIGVYPKVRIRSKFGVELEHLLMLYRQLHAGETTTAKGMSPWMRYA